jgi:hypothetical protein
MPLLLSNIEAQRFSTLGEEQTNACGSDLDFEDLNLELKYVSGQKQKRKAFGVVGQLSVRPNGDIVF